jgi:hypothetical protein
MEWMEIVDIALKIQGLHGSHCRYLDSFSD